MTRRELARARATLQATIRRFFGALGYEEVETPCLVAAPSMEPHIDAFEAELRPEGGGPARRLWLHSSPEYAMKRLLAEGFERIFQLARVFRNGEVSGTHNPEFTMLELYEVGTGAAGIMARLEALLAEAAVALTGGTRLAHGPDLAPPFERVTVAEAFWSRLGVDVLACDGDAVALRNRLLAAGHGGGLPGDTFDDLFFRAFLEHVEPTIGLHRPTWVVEWPASMAALARLDQADPRVAERFELLRRRPGARQWLDRAHRRRRTAPPLRGGARAPGEARAARLPGRRGAAGRPAARAPLRRRRGWPRPAAHAPHRRAHHRRGVALSGRCGGG